MRHARILARICNIVLLLGSLCPLAVQAQDSQLTIKQLFAFGCDSNTKVCPDGEQPNSLLQSADGNFYGTAPLGGVGNQATGAVFKITPGGHLTVLYAFVADQNGKYPNGELPGSLVEGNDGYLYGTALLGGADGQGVVFKLSKTGALQILHSFCPPTNCGDGVNPSNLVLGIDGNLYGGTFGTNTSGGTLFRVTPGGSYTLMHAFNATVEGPMTLGMTLASDGKLYGTTVGGEEILTTLYRLTPSGQFTVLQTIHYGQEFVGPPMQASNGKLYGGLSRFEDQAEPAMFSSNLSGSNFENIVLSSLAYGDSPTYMTETSGARLWGIIGSFGNFKNGGLVATSPNGVQIQSVPLDGTNGAFPDAPLVQGSNGKLFGVTQYGGSVQHGDVASGVVFTLNAGLDPPKTFFVSFNPNRAKEGSKVMIHGVHFIGATQVTFNGVSASFQVLNTGNILATVPTGATSGPIAVTNAGGTTTSTRNFTVE